MKTDFEKSSNKLNITIMVVTLIFCLLMTGGFAVLINADKLGIGKKDDDVPEDPIVIPGGGTASVDEETNIHYYLEDRVLESIGRPNSDTIEYTSPVPVSTLASYQCFFVEDDLDSEFGDITCDYTYFFQLSQNLPLLSDTAIALKYNYPRNWEICESVSENGFCPFCDTTVLPDSRFTNFIVEDQGIYLKLFDSVSNEYRIVGGYSLRILSDFIISNYSVNGAYLILNSPLEWSCSDRSIFDPENIYPEFDRAEFYSYGDSYFEFTFRNIINYSHIALDIPDRNQNLSILSGSEYLYCRFRVY